MLDGRQKRRISVLCPVLDDWESFSHLMADMVAEFTDGSVVLDIIAVDDGSAESLDWTQITLSEPSPIASIKVIRLATNLGHQRAIAIGLVDACASRDIEGVLVMDSDGEDRPADAVALIARASQEPNRVILAHRTKRTETRSFKISYLVYKLMFFILTGRPISFGNFSFIPLNVVDRLCLMPELWNNLAAAIVRSRLPHILVPTRRGHRYAGRSKMRLIALVIHGLSAMSVYSDVIFVRLLIGTGLVAGIVIVGIVVVIAEKLMTSLAIPGWATSAVGVLLILLAQSLGLAVFGTLQMLSARSSRPIIPLTDCRVFIKDSQQRHFGGDADSIES